MKNLKAFVCAILALALAPTLLVLSLSTPVYAAEDYRAKLNESGEYCARVKTSVVGYTFVYRTQCRTLEEWAEKGYKVTDPQTGKEVEI